MGGNEDSSMEPISLKISFGNEIRRVTQPSSSYVTLAANTAELFGIDKNMIVFKYEDDDGDKICMSSEIEFQEAIRLSKQLKKILRLFVEVRTPEKPADSPQAPPVSTASQDIYLGPGGRFGRPPPYVPPQQRGAPPPGFPQQHGAPPPGFPQQHGAPPPGFPQFVPHPFFSQGTFHPVPSFQHPGAFHPGAGPFGEGDRKYHGPEHHRHHHAHHGSPAEMRQHWSEERKCHRDSKKAMRESWKELKKGATNEEDRKALKELKHQMKEEWRQQKTSLKTEFKVDRDAMRSLKLDGKKPRLVARHVEDVTIPDGTELPPNTPFLKTWKIRNEGPAWPTGSQLLFVSHRGDNLNGPERVVIKGEVLPGQEVEVSVPLITPNEPGRYVGYYRMVTPDGIKFGQRVWVSFIVKREGDFTTTTSTIMNNNNSNSNSNNNTNLNNSNNIANTLSRICDSVDV